MPLPGRKRASLVLLLVLAAGLAAAGAAGAAATQEMACCPAGSVAESPCTWLGAADCCPERPSAPTPTHAASAASAACGTQPPARLILAADALAPDAPTLPSRVRTIVLRL